MPGIRTQPDPMSHHPMAFQEIETAFSPLLCCFLAQRWVFVCFALFSAYVLGRGDILAQDGIKTKFPKSETSFLFASPTKVSDLYCTLGIQNRHVLSCTLLSLEEGKFPVRDRPIHFNLQNERCKCTRILVCSLFRHVTSLPF